MPFAPDWLVPLIQCLYLLFLLFSLFWLWMIIDSLRNKTLSNSQKLLWALLILFTHIFGAVFYFLYRRSPASASPTPIQQPDGQPQEIDQPYQQGYQENAPHYQKAKKQKSPEEPQAYYPEQHQFEGPTEVDHDDIYP